MKEIKLLEIKLLDDRVPHHELCNGLDLVIIKYDKDISVLYGRCHHRGALLGDGFVDGNNLFCGLHGWDYRIDTGISAYNNDESLHKFSSKVVDGWVIVDGEEIENYLDQNPEPFDRDAYLGQYADTAPIDAESHAPYIKNLATNGLSKMGKHGKTVSMGVKRDTLPMWDDIQYLPAQLATRPLFDDDEVDVSLTIGPAAKKPLKLDIPILVSDMSFGALSKEAKIALARGAELAGTGICSGEGGMLKEENQENSKYFYEYASGKFGFTWQKLQKVQAFHFKGGQGAKTGVGGHLPGNKVNKDIAKVRGLNEGEAAISPATFRELKTVEDFRQFANKVREKTGGIPIGFKIAASHIEDDIDFALEVGVDYIILDGRGGATGAAPEILRDNINVPTIPALARARRHLDMRMATGVTLIITGGLRVADDFAKAMMLGADGVAVANSALQAIGCLGMRACASNNCPVGIATQKENLRQRLIIDASAEQLNKFLTSSTELIKVIARSCGYDHVNKFKKSDLSTIDLKMRQLTGINYAGFEA